MPDTRVRAEGQPELEPIAIDYAVETFVRGTNAILSAEVGLPSSDFRSTKPPEFVHLVIESGDVDQIFETFTFVQETATPLEDVRLEDRSGALRLGPQKWGDRTGSLILAPPYEESASLHGDHLIFRWRNGDREYALSLHAWQPLEEAVATLRLVVESLPR